MPSNYKELTEQAFKYHSENNFSEAEKIYRQILSMNPEDVNVLNLLGLLCLSLKRFDESIKLLTKAFVLKKNSYISSNLGKAYYMNNQPELAVKIYKESLEIEENDDIYYSLGIAYKALSQYDKAIAAYQNALKLNPKKYNALYNLSVIYNIKGNRDKAIECAEKCLELNKKDESLYTLLYGYYEQNNDYDNALLMLKGAILLNPMNYIYHYNMGVIYSQKDDTDNAIISYIQALKFNPSHIESYVNLAALYKNKDNEKALEYLKKAYSLNSESENTVLSLAQTYKDLYKNTDSINLLNEFLTNNPKCAEAYSLLGINYMDTGKYDIALDMYNKALEISPNNNGYKHGKAIAYKYLGNKNECKSILEEIVKNDKTALQSAITLGMIYLSEKDFKRGMELYSLRSNESKLKSVFKDKIWDKNTDIRNKDVLIYTDCGLGDTIMFARYLRILRDKVFSITVQTDTDLVNILSISFPEIRFIKKGITPPKYDVIIPIMDLPIALNMDFSDIPNSDGYLKAGYSNIFDNIEELQTEKKKIGLFWQGNKRIFKNRSIPFSKIKNITENNNADFYSFQIDNDSEDYDKIIKLKKYINDYSDTALLLKKMDLLITIDSSIAHMAGALGIKTYLLIPYTSEWRWFNDTETTPWYNSVKIFRQKNINDWDEVIDRVNKEL